MEIKFTKMQGLGNDFVVLDFEEYKKSGKMLSELAKSLCDRNFGIGADGLIVINPETQNTDIGWFFYNSDGTTAQMCGNGIRCFAKYVFDKGLVNKKTFTVETLAGTIIPEIQDNGEVKVNMSKPILESKKIPFTLENNIGFKIKALDTEFTANAVSMGNPHCVIFENNKNTKDLAKNYGPYIEVSELFPEKTNVEFIKVVNQHEINLDVWERGCGITLACGTGACASVTAGILNNYISSPVTVNLPGGKLKIEWSGNIKNTDFDIFMTGPATYSFTGVIACQ